MKLQSKEAEADLGRRLSLLRNKLVSKRLDAFLVSSLPNRYYFTGWMGDAESGFLLITQKQAFIIVDSRYTEEVSKKVGHFELVELKPYEKFWEAFFQKLKVKKVGFESQNLSVFALKKLKSEAKIVKWVPTVHLVEELRNFKDETEIKLIKTSLQIAQEAFIFALKNIKPGQTEIEVARKIEQFMREKGAEKNAWENFIVGSGPNSSMVHYAAGKRKIKKGDMVQLDWGCVYKGYYCDISRVVFVGKPSAKQKDVYNLVKQAQEKALERVQIGIETKEIDNAARDFLKNKTQFYFRHAVGHGVGLEVHELPKVNEKSTTKIQPGQVFTIEPGIYIPSWGGVRLEDMVLVTERGYEVLTKATKEIDQVTLNF